MKIARLGAVCVSLSTVLISCQSSRGYQPPPSTPPVRPAFEDVDHRISYSGETLAGIAAWYTGKSTNWQAIQSANPGLRPNRLNIGQHIIVPGELVVRRDPMPRKFLGDSSRKKTTTGSNVNGSAPVGKSGVGSTELDSQARKDELDLNELLGEPPTKASPEPTKPTIPPDADGLDSLVESGRSSSPAKVVEPLNEPVNEPVNELANEPRVPEPTKPATGGDKEREQLLDELLTQ